MPFVVLTEMSDGVDAAKGVHEVMQHGRHPGIAAEDQVLEPHFAQRVGQPAHHLAGEVRLLEGQEAKFGWVVSGGEVHNILVLLIQ